MPKVLTGESTIECAHNGKVIFTASQGKLMVAGQLVLVTTDVTEAIVSGCSTKTDPMKGTKQCTKVTGLLVGAAAKLSVDGILVLLETASGMTDGLAPAPGTWKVMSVTQTKLRAI